MNKSKFKNGDIIRILSKSKGFSLNRYAIPERSFGTVFGIDMFLDVDGYEDCNILVIPDIHDGTYKTYVFGEGDLEVANKIHEGI